MIKTFETHYVIFSSLYPRSLHVITLDPTRVKTRTIKVTLANTCINTDIHNTGFINSNKSPTRCNNFPVYYLDVFLIVVLCSWWAPPRTQHDCHNDTKVKPEVATEVIQLLMIGGKTPKTCWAVNKRQDNKLENCFIWLVTYLHCTMKHGLTNLK
jgi:hypothetical protein